MYVDDEDSERVKTYLGLDLSTQQLKAVIIDDNLKILNQECVHFDNDLPEFRTHGGVVQEKIKGHEVTVPTLMWVKALDMLMDRLTVNGADFSKVVAISGTAQQHGSVYWQMGSGEKLKSLDSSDFLHNLLASSFSVNNSPIWMDSSTTVQCRVLEEKVGGAENLAKITGSRAYERFTGPQIAKISKTKPDAYKYTERISLVSSFLCSLFLGRIAPIDISDGSGMNLLDIHQKKWNADLLKACGEKLEEKLGDPVPSNSVLGNVSTYFQERWYFRESCKVVAFTGDNPASLVGMGIIDNWIAVSLGTSDTLFFTLKEPKVVLEGHVFCNPTSVDTYMAMLCFKNGSLTREKIRNNCALSSWEIFNQLLNSTPRGNFGNMGLYYTSQEIVPFLYGEHRYNKAGDRVTKFTSLEVEVRALIEGQALARRAHAEDMGLEIGPETRILATGGASQNKAILQVISDVFNSKVYIQKECDSAMLGAAYQAKYGHHNGGLSYEDLRRKLPEPELVCEPAQDASDIYDPMVVKYRMYIANLLKATNK